MRLIDENIGVDRARQRYTLLYRVTPRIRAGVEWNPLANDLGLLANWRVVDETRQRPALILGTSSDRIGTSGGRAIFATLSKSLETQTGLPIAPYTGLAYGGEEHEFRALGGLHMRYGAGLESTHFYDGKNLHHVVTKNLGRHTLGALLAEQKGEFYLGITYSIGFSAQAFTGLFRGEGGEAP